jgi:hypothetical protein
MSVLVSYSYKVSKEKSFPKLMISEESLIVFFTSKRVGVAMTSNKEYRIGKISSYWDMDGFKDYNGEITLKNE